MKNKKILLGLTTTRNSNWREKIKEINKYNIKEIALFPTCLEKEQRQELYGLLENSPLKKIPHVHLRNDMDVFELDYLVQRWGTEVFNIHTKKSYPFLHDLSKYAAKIFVENHEIVFDGKKYLSGDYLPSKKDLQKWAGLCLDVAHREDFLLKQEIVAKKAEDKIIKLLEKFKIGCCHISAIQNKPQKDMAKKGAWQFSYHTMNELQELDYVKKYVDILPDIISIELENSFKKQLEAKKYLEKIIN